MEGLKQLVGMQLKDKIDFSFLKSRKKTIFKVVLSILKFGVITALIYFAFYFLSYLRLVSVLPGIPQNVMGVAFTVMILLSIIVCTFGLMKSLYFGKDNQFLLTLPASRTTVFTSKIIVYYLYELIKNITYILPLFLAYGIIDKMPFYYYLFLPIALVIITAVPVALGALLSIPAMYLTIFIKQNKWLGYILLTLVSGGVIVGLVFIIAALPQNIDIVGTWGTTFWKIQAFLTKFSKIFMPFLVLLEAFVGNRYGISNSMFYGRQWLYMLYTLLGVAVIMALTYLIVRPLYFKMTSSPFEYKREEIKKTYKNKTRKSFWSSIKKELVLGLRTPEKVFGLLAIAIGMPIAIFLLNKIYAAMDTRLSGTYMTVAFNILVILLLALSTNTAMSHIYSEEGASIYLMKTNPQSHLKLLFSKLVINIFVMSISIVVTTAVFLQFTKYNFWQGLMLCITFESVYLSHLFMSAEMDVMNPQTEQYQTTGGSIYNPNEIKSTIYLFLFAVIFAFLTFFFIKEGPSFIIKVMLISVIFLALRIWLYTNKVRLYFKEKQ